MLNALLFPEILVFPDWEKSSSKFCVLFLHLLFYRIIATPILDFKTCGSAKKGEKEGKRGGERGKEREGEREREREGGRERKRNRVCKK